jgi:hypothetical protein
MTELSNVGLALAAIFSGWHAYRSNKQTKNTGNGFANHTTESLQALLDGQERVERKIDAHLQDHASADVRR